MPVPFGKLEAQVLSGNVAPASPSVCGVRNCGHGETVPFPSCSFRYQTSGRPHVDPNSPNIFYPSSVKLSCMSAKVEGLEIPA